MKKYKKLTSVTIVTLILFLLVGFARAVTTIEPTLVFKKGEPALIRVPCFVEGSYCSPSAVCKITIFYLGEVLVNDATMTNEGALHTYNFTQPNRSGEYRAHVVCSDFDATGFSTFLFEVNPVGARSGKGSYFGYVLLSLVAIGIFLFTFGIKSKNIPFLFVFIVFGFIFLIFAFNTFIISPDVNVAETLSENFGKLYILTIYAFIFVFIILIIYVIFELIQWNKYRKIQEMKKWGLWVE